ncbi:MULTISPECIES: DUF2461 family protein [unclassified Kribbella]|uniref:DUF2461 family protein n=1 Tax=unclassified Kribbella TaxID=2644121 RepID=UPI0030164FD5
MLSTSPSLPSFTSTPFESSAECAAERTPYKPRCARRQRIGTERSRGAHWVGADHRHGLQVGVAWWYAPSVQIERYRAAVADPGSGRRLVAIIRNLEQKGFVISGDLLKRPLRGYPANHLRANLLRHRSVIVTRPPGCEEWIRTSAAADRVLDAFAQLRPLARWLVKNVLQPRL